MKRSRGTVAKRQAIQPAEPRTRGAKALGLVKLHAEADRKRRQLEEEDASCADLEAQAAQLEQRIQACTGRAHMHTRTQLRAELTALQDRIALLQSGRNRCAFERLIVDAADAINRHPDRVDSVAEEAMAIMDNRASAIVPVVRELCHKCALPLKITAEAQLACPECGLAVRYLDSTAFSMAYGDEVDFTHFSYKREAHMQECMNQFQAKQSTEVPREVLSRILARLREKYHVQEPDDILQEMIKPVLKTLQLRKLYEHSMLIFTQLSGKPPPRMTPEQERNIKMLFRAIQTPFDKHRPPERRNFLSYSYCLFKFCQVLGYTQFLRYFSLLKGDDKLHKQDMVMVKIFRELEWEWIPTKRYAAVPPRRQTARCRDQDAESSESDDDEHMF